MSNKINAVYSKRPCPLCGGHWMMLWVYDFGRWETEYDTTTMMDMSNKVLAYQRCDTRYESPAAALDYFDMCCQCETCFT